MDLLFPLLQRFYKGFIKELKALGKADTRHNDPIDEVTEEKIDDMLSTIQKLMEEKDKSSQRYKNLVLCLPEAHREDWHRLAQYGAMYICVKYCARRAREGIFFQILNSFFSNFTFYKALFSLAFFFEHP